MSRKRKTPDDGGGDQAEAEGSMPTSDSDEGMNSSTILSPLTWELCSVHVQVTGENAVKKEKKEVALEAVAIIQRLS